MTSQRIPLHHPLLDRLRRLDQEAAGRFPHPYADPGFGSIGLILDKKLDQSRHDSCTPLNCRTFAGTGGEGVHFSLLVQDGKIQEHSPVVVSIPAEGGQSFVVGQNLFDFLCLGVHRGYFSLEQLVYHRKLTLESLTNPAWQPTESWHGSVGFVPDAHNRRLLRFLATELQLQPWPDAKRFALLQRRYCGQLVFPEQSDG